jgi:DNA-binding IclR family transcriptional regulator
MNMGVLDVFAGASDPDISLADLAEQIKADPLLLSQFLRVLVDGEFLKETGPSRYAALPLAKVFATGSPFSAAIIHFEIDTEVVSRLPAYFEARGYTNPSDAYDEPFQYTIGAKQHYFD